jgi:CRP-like cAMP-binding protein
MNHLSVAPTQILETMGRLAYFQGWPLEIMERLASGAKLFVLPKNQVVVHKGDRLEYLYVVVSGRVRLFLSLPNNVERVLALLGKGESFGESCAVLSEPCPFDVAVGQDSHLLALDTMVYRREIRQHAELTTRVMERMAQRLLDNVRDLEICAQPSSVLRVVGYLMQHKPGTNGQGFEVVLPGRKRDIAAKLGLTQETFSRVLSCLSKQGCISVSGSRINVTDEQRLTQISPAEFLKKSGH